MLGRERGKESVPGGRSWRKKREKEKKVRGGGGRKVVFEMRRLSEWARGLGKGLRQLPGGKKGDESGAKKLNRSLLNRARKDRSRWPYQSSSCANKTTCFQGELSHQKRKEKGKGVRCYGREWDK